MTYRLVLALAALLLAALSIAACNAPSSQHRDPETPDTGFADINVDAEPDADGAPTYHGAVRAIVEKHCLGCHSTGGIGPFVLQNYEQLSALGPLVASVVQTRTMPPWMADPACRTFDDQRVMSDEEIGIVADWVAGGMPEGDATTYAAPDVERTELGVPDIVAKPVGPYTPEDNDGDDYRCFLLDAEFTAEDTWVRALDIDPTEESVVHHANMFLINPQHVAAVEALENADPEPGYRCYGDVGISSLALIGAWVPGMQPIELPPGTALRVPRGSRIVMQGHFNTASTDPKPARPEFHLFTSNQPPELLVRAMPFANLTFEVQPGDASSVHTLDFRNLGATPWRVFGTAAHLHTFAKSVSLEIIHKDGGEACLLDIPRWDFGWQQAYFLPPGEFLDVEPGDIVRLTCAFDNSPANQPAVDGTRQEPQLVEWGGGTLDEMCVAFLVVAEAYDPDAVQDENLCDSYKSCSASCEDSLSIDCIFSCGTIERSCGECLVLGAQSCAEQYCPDEMDDALSCLLVCAQGAQAGGDINVCLEERCPVERDALQTCIKPPLENGLCNDDLAECNVTF